MVKITVNEMKNEVLKKRSWFEFSSNLSEDRANKLCDAIEDAVSGDVELTWDGDSPIVEVVGPMDAEEVSKVFQVAKLFRERVVNLAVNREVGP